MEDEKLVQWLEQQPNDQLYAIIGKYGEYSLVMDMGHASIDISMAKAGAVVGKMIIGGLGAGVTGIPSVFGGCCAAACLSFYNIPFFKRHRSKEKENNTDFSFLQELANDGTLVDKGKKLFAEKKCELQQSICTNHIIQKQIDKKRDNLYYIITVLAGEQHFHRFSLLAIAIIVIRFGLMDFCSSYKSNIKEWEAIKESIIQSLQSRGLKDPSIRIRALNNIEKMLKEKLPEYLSEPLKRFKAISKTDFKTLYTQLKGKKLNGAESSIINEIYKRIM